MKENKGFISFQCKVATRKSKMGPVLDFPVTKYISSWTKNIVNDLFNDLLKTLSKTTKMI